MKIDPVEHLYFGDVAPPALLGRVHDYFLIQYNDDASDGNSQENSDEDLPSDSSAVDKEDEFPDFFVMPETTIATYGKALSAIEIPHHFADAMLCGGPPNSHWWVFIHSSDDAGPLKLWLRMHQGAHTPNPTHFLAGRGWKRIVRNKNLRQGDFILFQIRSLNLRVLLLKLPQPLF
ncbi:hypothetical protein PIB30_066440 [Stylosanthes scabra]|uniref:TF-B3 domain-containing protein n=1 Tax=Stylosanthes scabra TaxID=79078 RepID=A0ABU6YKG2_9FABA|nr:hypothetical protein [Stylosanthes scabra]